MSTQNVNVARLARNVEWDFFCDFQTPCFLSEDAHINIWTHNFFLPENAHVGIYRSQKLVVFGPKLDFQHILYMHVKASMASLLSSMPAKKKGKVVLQNQWSDSWAQCLKITEKVPFNIASEASYVYILSGQKLIKNAKNGQFWQVFENLKVAFK